MKYILAILCLAVLAPCAQADVKVGVQLGIPAPVVVVPGCTCQAGGQCVCGPNGCQCAPVAAAPAIVAAPAVVVAPAPVYGWV
jgi:hypothetical protein